MPDDKDAVGPAIRIAELEATVTEREAKIAVLEEQLRDANVRIRTLENPTGNRPGTVGFILPHNE